MPRKARSYKKHKVEPDPRYNNVKVAKFINYIMQRGKKTVAQRIVYSALDFIKEKMNTEPRQIFDSALKNVSPHVEIRGRRIGGANYQVPMEVPTNRQFALAARWIMEAAHARSGKTFSEKLAGELMDASKNEGPAIRRREESHRMAEANRAFSHYRV